MPCARISGMREVARGTLEVTFGCEEPFTFKAGQFFTLILPNPPYTDERGNRRYFSIINPPGRKGIITIATRMRDSAFKRSLREMPIGGEVEVGKIAGNLVLPDDGSRPLVMIAGGIGIAPFMSMIRHVNDEKLDYRIALLYSNRNLESAAYLDELKQMPIRLVITMDGDPDWPGEKRTINAQFIRDYVPECAECSFMVAGPPGMSDSMLAALQEAGVEKRRVKVEKFVGY